MGQLKQAQHYQEESLNICRVIQSGPDLAKSLRWLGVLLSQQQETLTEGYHHLIEARDLFVQMGWESEVQIVTAWLKSKFGAV